MKGKTIAAVLAVLLASVRGECGMSVVHLDMYPLAELEIVAIESQAPRPAVAMIRASVLAGAVEVARRPKAFQLRLVPLAFQKVKNQSHLRVVLLGPGIYAYDADEGVKFEMGTVNSDLALWSLVSWRGKSNDPYLSGGFSALMGEIIGNYGFRAADGSRMRVCKLTDALLYENNEKHGRKLSSLWGWAFSCEWDRPRDDKAWDFGLLRKCFNVGRRGGRAYGRFLWIPIGNAPSLWPTTVKPSVKVRPRDRKTRSEPASVSV